MPASTDPIRRPEAPAFVVDFADRDDLAAYHRLRHDAFVDEQGLFENDRDEHDEDPRTRVLVARTPRGDVIGGVRLGPLCSPDVGWWRGSRLVVAATSRLHLGVGPALVRAACDEAAARGVLRFDALVQERHSRLFARLGWQRRGDCSLAGMPHARMEWPIDRLARHALAAKSYLGDLLRPLFAVPGGLGSAGFVGDDGAPVPGSDLVAACDAVLPSMVEHDPEWAGWCAVLVNLSDISAMGARAVGLLNALGAPTTEHAQRVIRGVADASVAWGVPVLGGHTQIGVAPALSVTALGAAVSPIPASAVRAGDMLRVTVDTGGGWRPGYPGRQWDSSSRRSAEELRALARLVPDNSPRAAKDISMAGMIGTIGMMCEASGVGAEVDMATVPRPAAAAVADWLTCFPGYGMITADAPGTGFDTHRTPVDTATCGMATATPGVRLRWPDGEVTDAVPPAVTHLGAA